MDADPRKLTPQQRQQAEKLFAELERMPPASRGDALTNAECDDSIRDAVRVRMSSIEITLDESSGGELQQTVTAAQLPPDEPSVRRIGNYRIKRLIGVGGMGQVFEAMQDHPRRSVALKVMRSAIATEIGRRRFEYEVQILGRLKHPNIAQIYDADVWHEDGQESPYFVMEYVSGKPIDEHVRANRLDLEARLRLFLEVCDAISHGHERGIIHRDLKPGNILVDGGGHAKVIDFGVARATDSDLRATEMQTAVGQLIGTLQYMSPEQCVADPNDIDIRSDVYALGVVLFELLSDRLPYDIGSGGVPEAVRVIIESAPTRLTTVNDSIHRDVEVIVGKALEKDRDRRYRSAGELGDDIRRYLEDEPIIARPPSLSEHIRRYARKNRAAASAILTVAITLVVSIAAIIYFAMVASEQRDVAQQEAVAARVAEAKAIDEADRANRNFSSLRSVFGDLFGDLHIQVRNLEGGMEARETLLEMGREHIKQLKTATTESEDEQLLIELARSHEAMGDLHGGGRTANLGRVEEALADFVKSEAIWKQVDRDMHRRAVLIGLSRIYRKQADLLYDTEPARAALLVEEARTLIIPLFDDHPDDTDVLRSFYLALESQGWALSEDPTEPRLTQALALFNEYRDLALRLATAEPGNLVFARDTALAFRNIGWTRVLLGQLPEAETAFRDSLARFQANADAAPENVRHHRDVGWGFWYLSEVVIEQEGHEEGSDLLVRSAESMVTAFVRQPTSSDYRSDVGKLLPVVCQVLIDIERTDAARSVRSDALIRITTIIESDSENSGALALRQIILGIEIDVSKETG